MSWIDGHGFSYDDEWFAQHAPSGRLSLEALDDVPYVVLLGEGGSGKSTELRRWQRAAKRALWIEGRALVDRNAPFQRALDKPDFLDWTRGDRALEIAIDGLDESPLNAATLLQALRHELSGYSSRMPHLKIRIACRSAVWTTECESALDAVWGPSDRRTVAIRPLSRADVRDYFAQQRIADVAQRLDHLVKRGLGPSLSRPLLLHDAVESLRVADSIDVVSIRRRGVQRQLVRDTITIDAAERDKRLAAAKWIAALFVLGQRSLDHIRRAADELSGHVRIRAGRSWRSVEVTAETIERLFRESALFERAEEALGWAHQSWAEFLCAEWIAALPCDAAQKCALLAQEDGSLDVVPETIDATLSYLAMIDSDARAQLVARAPFSLLRSDGTAFDDDMRRSVMEGIFALARRLPARVQQWGTSIAIERFVNAACDEQLAGVLLDRSRHEAERWVALWGNASTPKQVGAALQVSLDPKEADDLRALAAERVAEFGSASTRLTLLPLLEETSIAGGRLTMAALDALWRDQRGGPSAINFEQLLATINRIENASRVIGRFHVRVIETLEDDELATLLAQTPRARTAFHLFNHHVVVAAVMNRGPSPYWIDRLVDVLLSDDPTTVWNLRQDLSSELSKRDDRAAVSMQILTSAARRARAGAAVRWRSLDPFHHEVSLSWLLDRCSDEASAELWCELALSRFFSLLGTNDATTISDAAASMIDARERVGVLRDRTRTWFEGMTRDDVPRSELEWVIEAHQRERQKQEQQTKLDRQREEWMRTIDTPDAYWRLIASSFVEEDHDALFHGEGIVSTRWWSALSESGRQKVVDASRLYLQHGEPFTDAWYLQSKIDYRALAGRVALELLVVKNRDIDASLVAKWSAVVLQDWGKSNRQSVRDELVARSAKLAPDEINERAKEMVRQSIELGQWVFVVRAFKHVQLDALLDSLPELLERVSAPESVIDPFDYWAQWRSDHAIRFAAEKLCHDGPPTALHIGLAASLVSTAQDAAWETVAAAFDRMPALFDAVLAADLPLEGDAREAWMTPLSTSSIVKLWRVWLARHRPRLRVPDGEFHTVSPADSVWDEMNSALQARAKAEPATLELLRELSMLSNAPAWLKETIDRGSVVQRARQWTARRLDQLCKYIDPPDDPPRSAGPSNRHIKNAMKRLFTWVHLSDIHFGHGARDALVAFDQAHVTRELPAHIGASVEHYGLSVDAVLVTGDVAFSGVAKEYETAQPWFEQLLRRARVTPTSVFFVPGNHDVHALGDDFVTRALVRALRTRETRIEFATAWNDEETMKRLVARQSAFWSFVERYAPVQQQGSPFKGWWKHELERDGRTLLLVGANTSLLSEKSDSTDQLAFGEGQLADISLAINGADVVLLLTHHPFSNRWLRDEQALRPRLKARCLIHLSGHVHDALTTAQHSTSGQKWQSVAAGAVHQDGRETSHQYSICSIVERDGQRVLQQWPFRWSASNARFELDTSLLDQNATPPGELSLGPC